MINELKEHELKEHKELHNKIWNCKNEKCNPVLRGVNYCKDCQKVIIDFMNKYGAGVLTRDKQVEDLQDKIRKLELERNSLDKKFLEKIKKVEELKQTIKVLKKK